MSLIDLINFLTVSQSRWDSGDRDRREPLSGPRCLKHRFSIQSSCLLFHIFVNLPGKRRRTAFADALRDDVVNKVYFELNSTLCLNFRFERDR